MVFQFVERAGQAFCDEDILSSDANAVDKSSNVLMDECVERNSELFRQQFSPLPRPCLPQL